MNIWVRRTLLLIVLCLAAVLVAIPIFLPAGAAYACPWCYGLRAVAPGVYLEKSATDAEQAQFLESLAAAERALDFYSKLKTEKPVILACISSSCDQRLGGKGAKARVYGATFIHVSPDGGNATILTHELAHIELHGRMGTNVLISGRLPAWFDEGLAVIISRDTRYLKIESGGELACSVTDTEDLPITLSDWRREAGQKRRPIYAMAACRVLKWLEKQGGAPAVERLAETLRQGGEFSE